MLNLPGFANWIYDFINERGGRVYLSQIEPPPVEWSDPLSAFEDALKHEQKVSSMINELVELANSERDHAT